MGTDSDLHVWLLHEAASGDLPALRLAATFFAGTDFFAALFFGATFLAGAFFAGARVAGAYFAVGARTEGVLAAGAAGTPPESDAAAEAGLFAPGGPFAARGSNSNETLPSFLSKAR